MRSIRICTAPESTVGDESIRERRLGECVEVRIRVTSPIKCEYRFSSECYRHHPAGWSFLEALVLFQYPVAIDHSPQQTLGNDAGEGNAIQDNTMQYNVYIYGYLSKCPWISMYVSVINK